MSFTPVATTDTLETFRTRYNATNITVVDDSSTSVDITLATDSLKLSGGTGIASAISGDTVTFNLSNTGVSAASYGSSTAIPVIAVNAQGQITSASTASISTDLTLVDDASSSATISLATDTLKISGGTGTTSAVSGDTLTINLDNTAVSAASYGSASAIPVITVDAQGRITAASTASVSSDLTIADTSSTTEVITLGSETLKFDGGTGISASISSGTVTYNFDGTSFTTFVYTATSGQTSFSGADDNGVTLAYSAGKRNVFLNGVLLDESDITASNGTSVVLASGAAASDILTVIAFAVNNIAVLDANGSEFVLDADGDTSITADTDDRIDFKTGGTDRVHIDSSGRVGIGTSSPDQNLHVSDTSTNAYIKIISNNSNTAGILFGDQDAGLQGKLYYLNGDDAMRFDTNGSERMRIDSSGNLKFNSGYGSVVTAFGVRAWVNFNGTGTVAIRASGGVSSVADRGTGQYTVVLTTDMPDNNYCGVAVAIDDISETDNRNRMANAFTKDVNEVYVNSFDTGGSADDVEQVNVVIVR